MSAPFRTGIVSKILSFHKDAVIDRGTAYTFHELRDEVLRMTALLSGKGIGEGAVVAVIGDYSFRSIAMFLALLEKRAVIVPATTAVADELNDRLQESSAQWSVTLRGEGIDFQLLRSQERHPLIAELADSGHAGLILFSSGSSGKPKAMVHDLDTLADSYRGKKEKHLTILVFLMFDHIGGINTLFSALATGATLVIPENRSADHVCSLVERYSINVLPSSPTFLNLILMDGACRRHSLASLRLITYGTEPMPESLLLRVRAAFPKVKLLQTFGTSETGIAQTVSKSSTSTLMKIGDGNLEYRVVAGELWLRSKTQILGYLNASMESFSEDSWFRTGDVVEQAEDGYLRIVGRIREIINVGGEKVHPAEIESLLMEIQQVADCLVYGERNAITGQSVVADVVPRSDCTAAEMKKIVRAFCKSRVAPYKIPARVNVVADISCGDRFKKKRVKEPVTAEAS